MPFPWKKKNRLATFSQILVDLQSPKRRVSLVVQTGFPTSLIDLFVKNRTRFKKSNSEKPQFTHPPPPPPPPPPPSPETTPPYQPSSNSIIPLPQSVVVNSDENDVSGRVGECVTRSGINIGVAVLVKMFVVLVLILSVKRVTVGITVSAFALVFLEYAGKRVVSPFSNANVAKTESLSKRVSLSACFFWFQNLLQLKVVKKGDSEVVNVQLGSVDEIEIVESKSEVLICGEESFLFDGNELDCDIDESPTKVVEPCGISECKSKCSSRSGRFKSKMVKKLVPKKFRGSKKEIKEKRMNEVFESESGSEVSSVVVEDKSHGFEIEEEEVSSLLLRTKLEFVRDKEKEEVNYGITCSHESLLAKEEVNNEKGIETVGNSGYTILLVIALAGLVVGRFPALILTITWCLILKLGKTIWRSQNKCAFHQMFCSKLLMEH